MSAIAQPSPSLLSATRETIYRAWLPIIGEAQAREQAEAFARRFQINGDIAHAR